MLTRDVPRGKLVWFVDERNHLRGGRCIACGPANVVLDVSVSSPQVQPVIVRRLTCFADEAAAIGLLLERLSGEIAIRETYRGQLMERLARMAATVSPSVPSRS